MDFDLPPQSFKHQQLMATIAGITGSVSWADHPTVRADIQRRWPTLNVGSEPTQYQATWPWLLLLTFNPPRVTDPDIPLITLQLPELSAAGGRPRESMSWLDTAFVCDIGGWPTKDVSSHYQVKKSSVDNYLGKGRKLWGAFGAWPWAVSQRPGGVLVPGWQNSPSVKQPLIRKIVEQGLLSPIMPRASAKAYKKACQAFDLGDVRRAAAKKKRGRRKVDDDEQTRLHFGEPQEYIEVRSYTAPLPSLQLYAAVMYRLTGEMPPIRIPQVDQAG